MSRQSQVRLVEAHYAAGSRGEYAAVSPPDQRWDHYDALGGRAAWFYEAVTNDAAMHGQETGWGQVYLAAYQDGDGDWLDGSRNYRLTVPSNAPMKQFWSITVYSQATRCLINNGTGRADRSSPRASYSDRIPGRPAPKPVAPRDADPLRPSLRNDQG